MTKRYLSLRQKGDTIVEVMVVLAVLGMAISVSYATASRSLQNARQAQESAEATELVQAQIEALRSLSPNIDTSDPTTYVYDATHPYCIDTTNYKVITFGAGADPADPTTWPATCRDINTLYSLMITYGGPSPSGDDTFTFKAIWPDVRGDGIDSVTQVYRVYPQRP